MPKFGYTALEEVKINEDIRVGAQSNRAGVLIRGGRDQRKHKYTHTEKAKWGPCEEAAVCKQKLVEATQSAVFCHGSPSWLIHSPTVQASYTLRMWLGGSTLAARGSSRRCHAWLLEVSPCKGQPHPIFCLSFITNEAGLVKAICPSNPHSARESECQHELWFWTAGKLFLLDQHCHMPGDHGSPAHAWITATTLGREPEASQMGRPAIWP